MSEWISVEDRLPEVHPNPVIQVSDRVLVFTKNRKISLEYFFGIPRHWSGGYYQIGNFVTHWMPLPDFPEVEDE